LILVPPAPVAFPIYSPSAATEIDKADAVRRTMLPQSLRVDRSSYFLSSGVICRHFSSENAVLAKLSRPFAFKSDMPKPNLCRLFT
jgi:hypothetical protein